MLKFKEGQIYVCKKSYTTWWTEGGEYDVFINENRDLVIQDNAGDQWCDYEIGSIHQFTLKEEEKNG